MAEKTSRMGGCGELLRTDLLPVCAIEPRSAQSRASIRQMGSSDRIRGFRLALDVGREKLVARLDSANHAPVRSCIYAELWRER